MARKKDYHDCLVTPFKSNVRGFTTLAEYFMLYAPNLDSAHSNGRIEGEAASQIFDEMIKKVNMQNSYKIIENLTDASWKKYDLSNDVLDFEQSRFTCKKLKNESNLQCLLRHIRNSLAHGYVYIWKKRNNRNYVFFVDYDSTRKRNRISAKIMVSTTILDTWKAILENQIATGE